MLIASNCAEWENEAIFTNALCGNERRTWVRYVATTNQMRMFNMNLSWIGNHPPQYFFYPRQSTLFFLVNCLYKEAIWLDEGLEFTQQASLLPKQVDQVVLALFIRWRRRRWAIITLNRRSVTVDDGRWRGSHWSSFSHQSKVLQAEQRQLLETHWRSDRFSDHINKCERCLIAEKLHI